MLFMARGAALARPCEGADIGDMDMAGLNLWADAPPPEDTTSVQMPRGEGQ